MSRVRLNSIWQFNSIQLVIYSLPGVHRVIKTLWWKLPPAKVIALRYLSTTQLWKRHYYIVQISKKKRTVDWDLNPRRSVLFNLRSLPVPPFLGKMKYFIQLKEVCVNTTHAEMSFPFFQLFKKILSSLWKDKRRKKAELRSLTQSCYCVSN